MAELVDLFAYLSVLLRGAVLVLQTLAVGGVAFELLVLRPRGDAANRDADPAPRRQVAFAAAFLAAAWFLWLGLDSAVLVGTSDLSTADVLGASYFLAGAMGFVAASAL